MLTIILNMLSDFCVFTLTGQITAKANNGVVDAAKSHCQPKVGIITSAKATSKHAPKAQKH